jgi:hypothetical protein
MPDVCECRRAYGLTTTDVYACASNATSWHDTVCLRPSGSDSCEHHAGSRLCSWPGRQRFAWLHFAKAGTSFGTALMHVANESLPTGVTVPNMFNFNHMNALRTRYFRRATFWIPPLGFGWHMPLSASTYTEFHGRIFAMFREPARRIVSSYTDLLPGRVRQVISVREYAKHTSGTMTGMVTGEIGVDGLHCQVTSRPVSSFDAEHWNGTRSEIDSLFDNKCLRSRCRCPIRPNVSLAIERMREGFAFVGLLEEWELSVCLLHAKFGGRCVDVEFGDNRPTDDLSRFRSEKVREDRLVAKVNATVLLARGEEIVSPDDPDVALYEVVRERFEREVREHGLTHERCADICPAYGNKVRAKVPFQHIKG